jgi:hypothetical protein
VKLLFVLALYREVPGWKILYILSKVCGVSVTNGLNGFTAIRLLRYTVWLSAAHKAIVLFAHCASQL